MSLDDEAWGISEATMGEGEGQGGPGTMREGGVKL